MMEMKAIHDAAQPLDVQALIAAVPDISEMDEEDGKALLDRRKTLLGTLNKSLDRLRKVITEECDPAAKLAREQEKAANDVRRIQAKIEREKTHRE